MKQERDGRVRCSAWLGHWWNISNLKLQTACPLSYQIVNCRCNDTANKTSHSINYWKQYGEESAAKRSRRTARSAAKYCCKQKEWHEDQAEESIKNSQHDSGS